MVQIPDKGVELVNYSWLTSTIKIRRKLLNSMQLFINYKKDLSFWLEKGILTSEKITQLTYIAFLISSSFLVGNHCILLLINVVCEQQYVCLHFSKDLLWTL